MAEKSIRSAPELCMAEQEINIARQEYCRESPELYMSEEELYIAEPEPVLEIEAPGLLIDLKQPLLPEIGRELCRVRDSDVKGKRGSGNVHVIRTYSRDMGGGLRATGYTPDRGEFRGYRRDILTENLSERESILLLCNHCKGIMREACISTTGEQFCECCRKREEFDNVYDSYEQTIPNTHVRNTVFSLKCSCPLQERGCEWLGTLGECENHLDVCSHVHEKCKLYCGIVLPREELKIHMNDKCEYRKVPCGFCKKNFQAYDMFQHQAKCPNFPLQCVKRCGTTVEREKMAQHLEKDCGRVIEECKLGCGIELPRDELKIHVNTKCVQRMMPCEYCHIDFKACDISNHNKTCKKMPLSCELRCGIVVCREDMGRHIEVECVEKKVECPFVKYKCEVGLIKRKELNQHLKEKRTEHIELKLSAMEEIVMQQRETIAKQSKMITKQSEINDKQSEINDKQSEINDKQSEKITMQGKMIAIQNGQIKTLLFITNTTKLEWRIEHVVKPMTGYTHSTSPLFQVDSFNFSLQLILGSIDIYYPRQELSKVKVKFIFRIISPSNPDVTWEAKSSIIDIKQKGGDSYGVGIAKIPAREEFIRDDGIDLEIFVTLL